jgi:4-hydroxy-2-oxoheptanedioate aldolase
MPDAFLGPPRLKHALRSGSPLFGMWLVCRDPYFIECAAYSGFDVLLIDAEHAPISMADIEQIAIIARNSPAQVMVRMPVIGQAEIKQVLDIGIEGIVAPMVNSVPDAKRLIDYSMYPPRGIRGIGPRRAQHLTGGAWEYQKAANDEIVVIMPQIEHIDAVDDLDAICGVEGLGGLFLGPGDLSLSMGLGGQYSHPDMVAAKAKVLDASRKHGLPLAVATTGDDDARYWADNGAALVMVASDSGLFNSAAQRAIAGFRR